MDATTASTGASSQAARDSCKELRQFLRDAKDHALLLQPEHLAGRLQALDHLDFLLGDLDPDALAARFDSADIARANELRFRLEAANEAFYEDVRAEVAAHGSSPTLHLRLLELAHEGGQESPRPGLGFDLLDEVVSGVLRFGAPQGADFAASHEMVAYQPTPTRHVLDLIAAYNFTADDQLIDLGSGLGHVPLLVSILIGIGATGVEIQPAYVATAQEAARNLNLSRVRFLAEDARLTDLSRGTVFYLFTPFTGSLLARVLDRLSEEGARRRITVCAFGSCVPTVQREAWLAATNDPDVSRISVFQSR